jgi:DNA-directed RNA polymerase specialized sigma24 family protein
MYASGVGFRAIERATGISHNTVINWVRQERKRLSDVSQSEENSEISLEDSEFDQPKILEPQNINSLLQQRIYELSLLQKCFSKLLSARFLKSLTSIYHDVIVQAL